MIVVVPLERADTKPVLETVATAVLDEIHGLMTAAVPVPFNCDAEPTQALNVPLMEGKGFTEKVAVITQPLLLV